MAKVAVLQLNVKYGDPAANMARAEAEIRRLSLEGVEIAVFPETYLTGYCVANREEAMKIAIDACVVSELQSVVDETGVIAVIGFAEKAGDKLYNSAALLEPEVGMRTYRKTHLPYLGLDCHVEAGDEVGVFDTKIGRIGIAICFDVRSPEFFRVMALRGVDLVCLPTNWPNGGLISANIVAPARAAENRIFLAAANRVGSENGYDFVGLSGIFNPLGQSLARAGVDEEVLIADCDFAEARMKTTVVIPGLYETTVFASRRPELYGELVQPK